MLTLFAESDETPGSYGDVGTVVTLDAPGVLGVDFVATENLKPF
jgi:hypothetical protein